MPDGDPTIEKSPQVTMIFLDPFDILLNIYHACDNNASPDSHLR